MNKICLIFLFLAAILTLSVAEDEVKENRSHEDGMKNRDMRSDEDREDSVKKEGNGEKETKSKVNEKSQKRKHPKGKREKIKYMRKVSKIQNRKQSEKGKPNKKGNKKGNIKESKNRNKASKEESRKWNKKGNRKVKIDGNNEESRKEKPTDKGHKNPKYNSTNGEGRSSGRQTCSVSDACFTTAVFYMKIWKDNVKNFELQRNRMTKQNKTGGNKSGKKGLFAPIVQRLIEAGGANRSNLSCNGNYVNAGAKQMANLTEILNDCELKINASCNPANFPQPNITLLTECSELVTTFTDMASYCLNRTTVSEACSCWTNSTLKKTAVAVMKCKVADASKAITKQLRMCTGNFSICRKFEDDTLTAIIACSKSTSKLLAKAKALTSNKNEMTTAKDKMSSLSGSSSSSRRSRATATKCSEIITKSKQITTLASDSPNSDSITTLSKEISSASVTCTTTEKTSLKTEVTSMTSSIAIVTVALETVQTSLKTITGTTASSTAIAAASDDSSTTADASTAKASTAKASGRRNMLIRDAMMRVNKIRT